MFFALSKILAFLLSPINWILFALAAGWLVKNPRRKRRAFTASALLFLVFTNGFVANTAMRWLEVQTLGRDELDRTYPAGILLGGMVNVESDTSQVNFNSNADRLFQTIDLYQAGKIEKIIISSGSGLLQLPSFKESYLIRKYLEGIGLPPEDIWIETRSRNTYENAVETGRLIEARLGEQAGPFLLITSASHMRRAVACFRKQGMAVVPYSTAKRAVRGRTVFRPEMILPDPAALMQWKGFFHEVTGLAVYRLTGRI